MSWKYSEPKRSDYRTQEEYERALSSYEYALDSYIEEYIESKRGNF